MWHIVFAKSKESYFPFLTIKKKSNLDNFDNWAINVLLRIYVSNKQLAKIRKSIVV